MTETVRLPIDRVYVAVLTNAMELPLDVTYAAIRVASEVVGEPYQEPTRITLSAQAVDAYVGVYSIDDTATRTITRDGARVFMQRTGAPKSEIVASRDGEFFRPGSFQQISFTKDDTGTVVALESRMLDDAPERARTTVQPSR
jgi:D-alanyl-D-alanine carboxypeptidase